MYFSFICIFILYGLINQANSKIDDLIEMNINHQESAEEFFLTTIFVGEDQQFLVEIDTTSKFTWVPSISSNITAKSEGEKEISVYDPTQSSTSSVSNKTVTFVSTQGELYGTPVNDSLYIGDDYEYYQEVYSLIQVNNFASYLGNNATGKLSLSFVQSSDFISNFEIRKVVLENNKLYFGGIPDKYEDYHYSNCSLKSTELLDDEYRSGWVCGLTHLLIGDQSETFSDAIDISSSLAIFDSTYHYISAPMRYLPLFRSKVIDVYFNKECEEKEDNQGIVYLCSPTEKFNFINITFIIEGYGYIFDIMSMFRTIHTGEKELLLRFNNENDELWRLGIPFMKKYTMVFDYDNKTVGFYGGEKEDFVQEWLNWEQNGISGTEKDKMMMLIVGLGILVSMFLLVVIFAVWKTINKNREKKMKESGPLIKNEQNNN